MRHEPWLSNTGTAARKPPEFVIRAAEIADLADFFELASVAGAGFTSLPADEAFLAERLHGSKAAFAGESGVLMLALEDRDRARVVGCAAIKVGGMARSDFLNFRLADDRKTLETTSLYVGLTEVGSLLVHPEYRQFGVGRWLAQSRYLAIAGDLERFGDFIFSELRGLIDENKNSPFYEGVLAHHFDLTYEEADSRSAYGRQAELNAMLPTTPIVIDDICEAAKAAIACPHQDGRKALRFLKEEGFRFEGTVDLLDGGPLVVAPSSTIRTIRTSFTANIMPGVIDDDRSETAILAIGDGAAFRSGKGTAVRRGGVIFCHPDFVERMRIKPGDVARVYLDRVERGARTSRPADQPALCQS